MSVSIGQFVRQCVLENSELKNQEILDKVLEKFPEAKTTISCIAWYKTDMRKKGLIGGRRSAMTKDGIIKEIELLEKRLETLKLQLKAMEEEAAAVGREQTEAGAASETETKTVAEKPSKSHNKSKTKQEQEPAIEAEPTLM